MTVREPETLGSNGPRRKGKVSGGGPDSRGKRQKGSYHVYGEGTVYTGKVP